MNPDTTSPLDPPLPPSQVLPVKEPFQARKIFIGKDGLRAGWSILIFALIFGSVAAAGIFIGKAIHPTPVGSKTDSVPSLTFIYINESLVVFAVLFASWIMSKIEKRPVSVYGYGGARKARHFLAGLVTGIGLISLLIFVLWKSGLLVVESRLIFGSDMARYGVLWLVAFILVGTAEESVTRGYLLYTMMRGFSGFYARVFKTRHSAALGFWTAAVILSIIFFLGHTSNPGESPVGLLSVFFAGMFFSLSVWRTGSLWWAIGMHAAWDWGQSFLFGVADSGIMVQHHLFATHPLGKPVLSGGTTGPEGSIFILGVLALGWLIIVSTLRKAPYGVHQHEEIGKNGVVTA